MVARLSGQVRTRSLGRDESLLSRRGRGMCSVTNLSRGLGVQLSALWRCDCCGCVSITADCRLPKLVQTGSHHSVRALRSRPKMVVDTRYYEILQVKTDADDLTIKKVCFPASL